MHTKLGDRMMIKNVRILVAAAATCALLGFGVVGAASDDVPVFHRMSATAGADGPVIHLDASGSFDTVHYSPQPGVWVVEMPEGEWTSDAAELERADLGVERAELSHVEEFGKRLTRLTVWMNGPSQLVLVPRANGLDLHLERSDAVAAVAADVVDMASDPVAEVAAHVMAEVDDPVVPETVPVVVAADPVAAPKMALVAATETSAEPPPAPPADLSLLAVEPVHEGNSVVVRLRSNGVLDGTTFTLPNPDRLVLDLPGVVNRVERHQFAVDTDVVQRVRVAQYQAAPVPITRIVVDLAVDDARHQLVATAAGAELRIEAGGHAQADAGMLPTVAAAAPMRVASGATLVSNDTLTGTIEVSHPGAATVSNAEPAPAEAEPTVALPPVTVPAAMFEQPDEPAPSHAAASTRSPWVADTSQLIERAPAGKALRSPGGGENFATTEVDTEEVQYTGDPITLTLKDADIKDVLRTFSTLTQLNIVIDPGVGGSVTVELRDVPWDQALDLILKINNLDYVLENNVLRVAPISKLAAEKRARADYQVNEEAAKPLKTVVKPLSYARAADVASTITGKAALLSPRGTIVVDERTNTLIIRDTIDRVEGVLRLVETLDQPTPQVVIEARIVETTRNFSRALGVSWGFSSTMDPLHGNDTGLQFPNTISANGDVTLLQGGNGLLSMSFGDILNTFNLDFVLGASEDQGLAKIVSTPRIQTQNLKSARIRSGIQIPVQTIANNTVTVQYVDATLSMEVTPQITAEGTVDLQVSVRKQRPTEAFAVQGGTNLPIFTREAQTQLLIRDGGTTVIGGIYQLTDDGKSSRVPFLADVPVLGHLFKNKTQRIDHDELLIFITPRIVKY